MQLAIHVCYDVQYKDVVHVYSKGVHIHVAW